MSPVNYENLKGKIKDFRQIKLGFTESCLIIFCSFNNLLCKITDTLFNLFLLYFYFIFTL